MNLFKQFKGRFFSELPAKINGKAVSENIEYITQIWHCIVLVLSEQIKCS